jgi:hypothetical protein
MRVLVIGSGKVLTALFSTNVTLGFYRWAMMGVVNPESTADGL